MNFISQKDSRFPAFVCEYAMPCHGLQIYLATLGRAWHTEVRWVDSLLTRNYSRESM
jgi:hypothetical protein